MNEELTTDHMIQLRSSLTDYVSATNIRNRQFLANGEMYGLCGIGV